MAEKLYRLYKKKCNMEINYCEEEDYNNSKNKRVKQNKIRMSLYFTIALNSTIFFMYDIVTTSPVLY